MKHKSIINLISGFFCLGILFSTISCFKSFDAKPEVIFSYLFAFLIITCILFFKAADNMEKKGNSRKLTNVVNNDLYIGKNL